MAAMCVCCRPVMLCGWLAGWLASRGGGAASRPGWVGEDEGGGGQEEDDEEAAIAALLGGGGGGVVSSHPAIDNYDEFEGDYPPTAQLRLQFRRSAFDIDLDQIEVTHTHHTQPDSQRPCTGPPHQPSHT